MYGLITVKVMMLWDCGFLIVLENQYIENWFFFAFGCDKLILKN